MYFLLIQWEVELWKQLTCIFDYGEGNNSMKIGKKNSQIITTISQQHVDYEEQWLVLEIAVIIKDIKDNIYS